MISPQLHQTGNPAVLLLARRSSTSSSLSPPTAASLSKFQTASLAYHNGTIRSRERLFKWLARHDAEVQFRTGVHPEISYKTRRTIHILRKITINRQRRLSKWVEDFLEAPLVTGTRTCRSWSRNGNDWPLKLAAFNEKPAPIRLRHPELARMSVFEIIERHQSKLAEGLQQSRAAPKQDVDMLLPEDVRATMGKKKSGHAQAAAKHDKPSEQETQHRSARQPNNTSSLPPAKSAPLGPVWRRDEGVPRVQLDAPLQSSLSRLEETERGSGKQTGISSLFDLVLDRPSVSKPQVLRGSPEVAVDAAETSSRRTTMLEKLRAHERERERQRMIRESWYSKFSSDAAKDGQGVDSSSQTTAKQLAATKQLSEEVEATKAAMQAHEQAYYSREPKSSDQPILQGEGDMSADVVKFANRDRWYKKPAPHALAAEEEKRAQKEADRALARDIRHIYESHYGTINTEHRQPLPSSPSSVVAPTASSTAKAQAGVSQPDHAAPSSSSQPQASSNSYFVESIGNIEDIRNLFGDRLMQVQNAISEKWKSISAPGHETFSRQEVEISSLKPLDSERLYKRQKEILKEGFARLPGSIKPVLSDEEVGVLNTIFPAPTPDQPSTKFSSLARSETRENGQGTKQGTQAEPDPNTAAAAPAPQPPQLTTAQYKIIQNELWATQFPVESVTHPSLSFSTAASEPAISLSAVLTTLRSPLNLLPTLREVFAEGYEPVAVTRDMVILRRLMPANAVTDVDDASSHSAAANGPDSTSPASANAAITKDLIDASPKFTTAEEVNGTPPASSTATVKAPVDILPESATAKGDDDDIISPPSTASKPPPIDASPKSIPTTTDPNNPVTKPLAGPPSINPIDGTAAPQTSPPAGNFASPTGFVNFGEAQEAEVEAEEQQNRKGAGKSSSGVGSSSSARVRREEEVFSGGGAKRDRKVVMERRAKRVTGKGLVARTAMMTAMLTAGGCYAVGFVSELFR
ncbi:MAG: hypothetical protein M1822_004822 [Bathelium mastoideum]|nr:MAG: hypothetical protein M1822_004822 [Bathelium mastoideum]